MKTLTNYVKILLITTSMITFTSCGKDDSTTPTTNNNGNNDPPAQVEGEYTGTWVSPNEKLPTEVLRNDVAYLELKFNSDKTYSWLFKAKPGKSDGLFEGIISADPTSFKHTSGSKIWQISIIVSKLNGQPVQGGWNGIYTYENPTTLILNVEPSVSSWTKWPSADEGIGSGAKGKETVYVFTKK